MAWDVLTFKPMDGMRLASRVGGGVLMIALALLLFAWHRPPAPATPPPVAAIAPPEDASPDDAPGAAPGAEPAPVEVASVAAPSTLAEDEPHADVAPRTTIAILQVSKGGAEVDLVRWVTKPVPCPLARTPGGSARWVLEDARTGAELAEGPCPLPRLLEGDGPDVKAGCVRLRHQAVVRLKLPRTGAAERLTIIGPDGPLAHFSLVEPS
jgi:hypothetical protein